MPRWWHHLRATLGGYFWLPCPLCDQPFGGHETKRCSSIPYPDQPNVSRMICRDCTRAGLGHRLVGSTGRPLDPPPLAVHRLPPGALCDECSAPVESKAILPGVRRPDGYLPPDRLGVNLPCCHDADATWRAE